MSGSPAPAPDKRQHARKLVELPVRVSDSDQIVSGGIRLSSADLSQGGAFLRADLLFEAGEELSLEISLPTGRVVRVVGRVAHVARTPVAGMGIEFVDLSEVDRQTILTFVRGQGA